MKSTPLRVVLTVLALVLTIITELFMLGTVCKVWPSIGDALQPLIGIPIALVGYAAVRITWEALKP